jgi:Na+/proline symporter
MESDAAMLTAAGDARKMHLYLPMNHPDLPWTGMLTGLMAMHFFYWGTNQFIVQRALGARSDSEARLGIVAAGFLKLTIPFFAIATGAAAFYLFKSRLADPSLDPQIHQDVVFVELVKIVAAPIGFGLMGLIAAGVIGAILSSIDSMMNSAATIVTIDIYRRYIRPHASDRELIIAGRVSIAVFVILATLMAVYVINPNSKKNFFLQIVDYQGYLTPGILVAFLLGMFWRRGTATAAIVAILAGIVFSGAVQYGYDKGVGTHPVVYSIVQGKTSLDDVKRDDLPADMRTLTREQQRDRIEEERQRLDQPLPLIGSRRAVVERFGPVLNFFHRVVVVLVLCAATFVVVSLLGKPDVEKGRLVWTDLGGHDPGVLRQLVTAILVSILVFAILGWVMYSKWVTPTTAAFLGSGWTLAMFVGAMIVAPRRIAQSASGGASAKSGGASAESGGAGFLMRRMLGDDRLPAGILSATAIFLTYYFY